jgi:hypothetical protein
MDMSFKKYLANNHKVFKFRIKALFPLEEECMDMLEKALQKYRPGSISSPVKTMYQTNPLGFTGAKNSEVWMTDVELTVPVTSTLLEYDLRTILGLHKDDEHLKVFGESQDELVKTVEPADSEAGENALLVDEHYEEVEEAKFEDYYGADYNTKFLEVLRKVEAERKTAAKAGNVDATHPITQWAKQPKAEPKDSDTEQPK